MGNHKEANNTLVKHQVNLKLSKGFILVLDLDFVIYSSLLVLTLIPLYIYREKSFKFKYENGGNFWIIYQRFKTSYAKTSSQNIY